jgi:hypothetical protein
MWRIVEKMIINLRVSQNLLILYTKSWTTSFPRTLFTVFI